MSALASLPWFEYNIHRHLDWREPLDWLGRQPFLVAEQFGRIAGVLALPADPFGVYWIRLFACLSILPAEDVFGLLFPAALEQIGKLKTGDQISSLAMYGWYRKIMEAFPFLHDHDIIVLQWEDQPLRQKTIESKVSLRLLLPNDLPEVQQLDNLCFEKIWQLSLDSLEHAYQQSGYATVAELDGEIIAYQLTSETAYSAHLARIAVHPRCQGQHVGTLLLQDLLKHYAAEGIWKVTVNTQSYNDSSLNLYERNGFIRTREQFPVYIYSG